MRPAVPEALTYQGAPDGPYATTTDPAGTVAVFAMRLAARSYSHTLLTFENARVFPSGETEADGRDGCDGFTGANDAVATALCRATSTVTTLPYTPDAAYRREPSRESATAYDAAAL